ncbi:selenocysteine-specific translation elongation factor [Clostridium lundense]|uniref:selenocysteine-specific translation elongation factor n=1 Tax=Clostridium lundense TaxID=319475 RepID=UPI00047FC53F|nr:selenocysteine-specific translation elongation factor [Clostridium lundense]
MKHIIIGTAGHIDHGKTALIKALTGRDTDNLKEEKERGISIDLGFTYFDLPSGRRGGIIDVPGHEKFIKNMLAGASSIDMVLMVIAADEGVMSQTKEHLQILKLLNIKKGIIVITKIDLVDEQWLKMVIEQIKEEVKGTFLQDAKIHAVSSKTKDGLESLIKLIDSITEEVESKDILGDFRLPVDRVFSVSGFGTIVTGTIVNGRVKEGDIVETYPSKIQCKVRGIQIHDEKVKFAEAGQRTALNLSNVKAKDIKRGDVISSIDNMEPSFMIDCNLHYLNSNVKSLENRQRVRIHHGTSELMCRVVILNKEEIKPGENAYVQLRLENPIVCKKDDRFVIRNYSPMYTIGGGIIIQPITKKAKRFDEKHIEELKVRESGSIEKILENTIEKISLKFPDKFLIEKSIGFNENIIEKEINSLKTQGKIMELQGDSVPIYIHKNFLEEKTQDIVNILEQFHKDNPLRHGIHKEEIKNKAFKKEIRQKIYDEFLQILVRKNIINIDGNYIFLKSFSIHYTKEQKEVKEKIICIYNKRKFSPPTYEELVNEEKDKKLFRMVYDSLIQNGELIRINEDIIFSLENYNKGKDIIIKYIDEEGSITLGEFRDLLHTSRKYAVALIEHFDYVKLTKRVEDKRVLT